MSRMDSMKRMEEVLGKRMSGDHLTLRDTPSVQKVLAKYAERRGDTSSQETVLFSDLIVKINPRGRPQERVLVITEKAIYNLLPSNYAKCKRRIGLDQVASVTQSEASSQFVLHIPSEYDYRLVSPRKQEIVECLARSYERAYGRPLSVASSAEHDLKAICVNKRMTKEQRARAEEERDRFHGAGAGSGMGRQSSEVRGWTSEHTDVTVDDFILHKVLGRGSFGKVMLCSKRGDRTNKFYAMKVLRKDAIIERNQVEHTKAEREILEKIDHPFLMGLHYAFQTKTKLYFVMDFLTGGELFFHLKASRRFDEPRAKFYAAQIVLGIEHLHHNGIIYRDLKPENVLLDAQGNVCLTDFGLSKRAAPGETSETFCGTPEYLAPEIVMGVPHDKSVDWWSLGILLFEMLVGLPPFYSENVNLMYELIKKAELRIPAIVSWEARNLLQGLLTRDPRKRLGGGPDDAAPIRSHAFFDSIDWDRLYAKSLQPPFVPEGAGIADVTNFDPEFTSEKAVDSVVQQRSLGEEGNFEGFTFQEKSTTLGK